MDELRKPITQILWRLPQIPYRMPQIPYWLPQIREPMRLFLRGTTAAARYSSIFCAASVSHSLVTRASSLAMDWSSRFSATARPPLS